MLMLSYTITAVNTESDFFKKQNSIPCFFVYKLRQIIELFCQKVYNIINYK